MAIHAGKKEFYERMHKIQKSEAEKKAEMREGQKIAAHKRGVHQTEERDR